MRNFLRSFLLVLLIKQDMRATKKIAKTLMKFFHKIKFLTENTINCDVTFVVILSTVCRCGSKFTKSCWNWRIDFYCWQTCVFQSIETCNKSSKFAQLFSFWRRPTIYFRIWSFWQFENLKCLEQYNMAWPHLQFRRQGDNSKGVVYIHVKYLRTNVWVKKNVGQH